MVSWGGLGGLAPLRNLRFPCLAPGGGLGGLAPSGISVNYPCLASAAAVPCPRALPPIFFRPNCFVRIFSSEFFRRNFFVGIFFVRRRSVVRPSVVRPSVRPASISLRTEKSFRSVKKKPNYIEQPLRRNERIDRAIFQKITLL